MSQHTYPAKSIIQNLLTISICIAVFLTVVDVLSILTGMAILLVCAVAEFMRSVIQSEPGRYVASDTVPDWVLRAVSTDAWTEIRENVSGSVITTKMILMYLIKEVRFITLAAFGATIVWSVSAQATYIFAGIVIGISVLRLANSLAYSVYKPMRSKHIGAVHSVDTTEEENPTALQEYLSTQLTRLELPPIKIKQVPESHNANQYDLFISQKRIPELYYGTAISSISENSLSETVKHSVMHEIGHLTTVRYLFGKYLLRVSQTLGVLALLQSVGSLLVAGLLAWVWILGTQLSIKWLSRKEEYHSDRFAAEETDESVEAHILSLLEPIADEHNPFEHPQSALWRVYILVCTHPPIESRIQRLIEFEE